jgi:hypothetical protein
VLLLWLGTGQHQLHEQHHDRLVLLLLLPVEMTPQSAAERQKPVD